MAVCFLIGNYSRVLIYLVTSGLGKACLLVFRVDNGDRWAEGGVSH